jgi:membrane-associated phospholipid phosphatase
MSSRFLRGYTFVDYATQAYAAGVAVVILFFHNQTVPSWQWLFAAHLAILALVHCLIRLSPQHARPNARTPHSALRTPHSESPAPHSALRTPHSGSPTPAPVSRTPHHAPRTTHHAPRTPLHAPRTTHHAPRSTLHALLDFLRHFYPVLLFAWFFAETGWLNRMFFPEYLDPTVIRWEQALFGCQPSLLFMEKLPYLVVSEIFYAAYFSYYLMIGGVGLALYLRNRQQFFHYVSVVSFLFYVCYTIFIVLPIIGPPLFFREIHNLPPDLQNLGAEHPYPQAIQSGVFFNVIAWLYRVFEAPGAALPSSHVAVALCTVCFSFRYLRPIRYLHLTVAILLCLSTVYCRYHYVLDVLTGIAIAAIVIPLGNWLYQKAEG